MKGRVGGGREREKRNRAFTPVEDRSEKEGLSGACPDTVLRFASQTIVSTVMGAVKPKMLILSDAFT